jgi:hypothetical protein
MPVRTARPVQPDRWLTSIVVVVPESHQELVRSGPGYDSEPYLSSGPPRLQAVLCCWLT